MNKKTLSICAAVVAFLFPTIGQAETPPSKPVKKSVDTVDSKLEAAIGSLSKLTKTLEANTKTLNDIKKSMVTKTELSSEVKKQVAEASQKQASKEELAAVELRLKKQEEELRQLKLSVGQLIQLVNSQGKEQQDLLDAIAEQDKDGKRIVSLSNMVDRSPTFKRELTAFVRKSQVNAGTLEVSNETRYDQLILVNTRRFRVPANTRQFKISVPVGVVVTELLGQEGPRRWVIDAANSTRRIRIQPARRVSLRPVVVRRPLFVRRPIIYAPLLP